MHWYDQVLIWASAPLPILIFLMMGRRNLYRRFPVFATYIAYISVTALLYSLFSANYRAYFYLYWYTQVGEMLLAISSVYESFVHTFQSFSRMWWFRSMFPFTIAISVLYAGLESYAHPFNGMDSLDSSLVRIAIVENYVLVGICALFFILVVLLQVRWRLYEFPLVLGFGIAATAFGIAGVVRSEFVTRFSFFSVELPGVAFIVAELLWLSAVLAKESPMAQNLPAKPTKEMVGELREQVQVLRRFLGKH